MNCLYLISNTFNFNNLGTVKQYIILLFYGFFMFKTSRTRHLSAVLNLSIQILFLIDK